MSLGTATFGYGVGRLADPRPGLEVLRPSGPFSRIGLEPNRNHPPEVTARECVSERGLTSDQSVEPAIVHSSRSAQRRG
jgi:hypothetical protein